MYYNGKISSEVLVLERKPDIAAGKFAFLVADSTARPLPGQNPAPELSARGNNPYALRARHALGQTPLWLGERLVGRRLEAVTIGSTFDPPTGISPKAATYVLYDYGSVAIDESNARDLRGARGASLPGRMTLLSSATRTGPSSSGVVVAQLIRKGVLVTVLVGSNPSRDGNFVLDRAGALRVARALRPVPLR
jgi:hypothetical protein